MMDTVFLDTLVKLASIGASGVCIFAIAWIGWILHQNKVTDEQHHKTLRFYMGTTVVIAFISAGSGVANAMINAGINAELRRTNEEISRDNTVMRENIETLLDSEAVLEAIDRSNSPQLNTSVLTLREIQQGALLLEEGV